MCFLSHSSYTFPSYKFSIYFLPYKQWQEEALGGIIAFILTRIHYALQTILDIIALGIILTYGRTSPIHPSLLPTYY